jgi:hypothetical protein
MSYSNKTTAVAGAPLRKSQECPRWSRCSVPICPLDQWAHLRIMHANEPVCPYISEAVKVDSAMTFEAADLGWLHKAITHALAELERRHGPIRHRLSRAKSTGSKMAAASKLRKG